MTHNNRGRIAINLGAAWRQYWPGPLPANAEALGTVKRGAEIGVLLAFASGAYRMGAARSLTSIDVDKVRAALDAASHSHGGARPGGGKRAADGAQGIVRMNVSLDAATVTRARELGRGNLSEGLRIAVSRVAP